MLVFGSALVVSEVSAALRAHYPLMGGASDYMALGIEFEISNSGIHAHQEAYLARVGGEAG